MATREQLAKMVEEYEEMRMDRMNTNEWEVRRWQGMCDRLRDEINEYFDFHLWVRRTYPDILEEWNAIQKIKGE